MKKIIFLFAILMFTAAIANADGDAGYAAPFLRSGVGARPLGMGGAFTAIAEGPEAPYYNPAGLGFSQKITLSLSYKSMSLDRHLSQVSAAFPIKNGAAMAANWVNAGVSNVPGVSESRDPLSDIPNSDNAFALSFAKAIDSSVSFGGNLKYIQQKLDQVTTFTIGVDVGAMAKFKRLISVGLVAQNIGSTYKVDGSKEWTGGSTYDDKFPLIFKFGAAGHLINDRLIPAIDFEKSDKMNLRFRTGAEFWFVKKVTRQVADEYEENKTVTVEENVRWAGLRAGVDRGTPTFGASYFFFIKKMSAGLEYAYLVGAQGTSASHLMTLKLGL